MAALTWTSTLEDRVAYALFSAAYSSLTTAQKTLMDGGSVANPPTSGLALEAYRTVQQAAQWLEFAGTVAANTAATQAAEAWLCAETTYLMAMTFRPERVGEFANARKVAAENYYDTVARTEITNGYTAGDYTLSLQSLRYYVIGHTVRRKERLIVPPEDIDAATRWCLTWFWHSKKWNFRRRKITISVVTTSNGSAPTINTASGETFDAVTTRQLYFENSTRDFVQWVNPEMMAALKADTNVTTGKPLYYRIERSGNTFSWIWHPYPDTSYTLHAEIVIALPGTSTPGVPTSATDTTPFAKIPTEFVPVFKELVLGRVLKARGIDDAVWKSAVDEVERMAPDYDEVSEGDVDTSIRDVYADVEFQWGDSQSAGGGML